MEYCGWIVLTILTCIVVFAILRGRSVEWLGIKVSSKEDDGKRTIAHNFDKMNNSGNFGNQHFIVGDVTETTSNVYYNNPTTISDSSLSNFFNLYSDLADWCVTYLKAKYHIGQKNAALTSGLLADMEKDLPNKVAQADNNLNIDLNAIFNEIRAELNNCDTQQKKETFVLSLLQPFSWTKSEFIKFYIPKGLLAHIDRDIEELKNNSDVGDKDALQDMISRRLKEKSKAESVCANFRDMLTTSNDDVVGIYKELRQLFKMYANGLDLALLQSGMDLLAVQEEYNIWIKECRCLATDFVEFGIDKYAAQKLIDKLKQ